MHITSTSKLYSYIAAAAFAFVSPHALSSVMGSVEIHQDTDPIPATTGVEVDFIINLTVSGLPPLHSFSDFGSSIDVDFGDGSGLFAPLDLTGTSSATGILFNSISVPHVYSSSRNFYVNVFFIAAITEPISGVQKSVSDTDSAAVSVSDPSSTTIPEAPILALMGLGLAGLVYSRRHQSLSA